MRFHPFTVALLLLVAAPALACPAHANVLISIDKRAQRMTVSVDGSRVYSWPVSTGTKGRRTPNGSFKPFRLEENHYGSGWN
jgi:lipoprotein-anchoring transpeptidase ErfK/SrfK